MAFCSRCGTQLNDGAVFCSACGAQQGQTEIRTVYVTKPKVRGRGFGISAMVLGIIGLVYSFAFISSVSSIMGFADFLGYEGYIIGSLLVAAIIYSSMSILGVVFGCTARKRGYRNGISMSGLVMGIIGLILYMIPIVLLVVNV